MHLLMSVMAGICYLYGSAGLQHLLSDSGVFAVGTAQHILRGKDFDCGMYAMKLIDEVLHTQFLKQFLIWCQARKVKIPNEFTNLLDNLQVKCNLPLPDQVGVSSLVSNLGKIINKHILSLVSHFRNKGRKASATFTFWDDFLCRVSIPLKMFLSATRNGKWSVYQSTKALFLTLLFASNRSTYSKYLPVLLMLMNRLPQEVKSAFSQGHFVFKLSKGKINGSWIDYAIETTENKDLKGTAGIIGLTLKGPALARWFLAHPVTAKY